MNVPLLSPSNDPNRVLSGSGGDAPGWPGLSPRWTSGAKNGVGTAFGSNSRVWFTLSHGILNEVYYPRPDQACIRDLGLIVTDGHSFFSEEKRHTQHSLSYLVDGVPIYLLYNRCEQGRYQIEKHVLCDPHRNAVLQRVSFTPLQKQAHPFRLFALLAPHLQNQGAGNTAWVGDYKGFPMLFAARHGIALALACSQPWRKGSAGFAGESDGWQDLNADGYMDWTYRRAGEGNVALTGEVDWPAAGGQFVLALAFGSTPSEAGLQALSSLQAGFPSALADTLEAWQTWQAGFHPLDGDTGMRTGSQPDLYRTSTMVLRVHQSKDFPMGRIASLSIPWGNTRGDGDLGGYHRVWPRDVVESAGGLLAAGALEDVAQALGYLQATQEADGHWAEQLRLDGAPAGPAGGVDEQIGAPQDGSMEATAFPILLLDLAFREGALRQEDLYRMWPMVRRAAGYLVCRGPVSPQECWEEEAGFSPLTLAVEVAALLVAADLAELNGESLLAMALRETADAWNANIERWTYVTGTDLARKLKLDGYYARRVRPDWTGSDSSAGEQMDSPCQILSQEALGLVRFGLRLADDSRICSTLAAIDSLLMVETPLGPTWRRWERDTYGEHAEGTSFKGTGLGRAWPLLTGERAHYEVAAGDIQTAERLRQAMQALSGTGGMLPEQVWDAPDLPHQGLFLGQPTGSATPLARAHAEYLKLCQSLREGRVFDLPPQTVERYLRRNTRSSICYWQFNLKTRSLPVGNTLRISLLADAVIHWSADHWHTWRETATRDTGLGNFLADLNTWSLPPGSEVCFTFYWLEAEKWEGKDFKVLVTGRD